MQATHTARGVTINDNDFSGLQGPALHRPRELLGVPAAVTATAHDHDASERQGRCAFTDLHRRHSPTEVTATIDRKHDTRDVRRIDEKVDGLRYIARRSAARHWDIAQESLDGFGR